MEKNVLEADVVVVGAGPVGLSLAIEMSHLGLDGRKVILVDANKEACGGSRLPKGQAINGRTLELWKRWGKGKQDQTVVERIAELRKVPKEMTLDLLAWNSMTNSFSVQSQQPSEESCETAFLRIQQPLYETALREFLEEIKRPEEVSTLFGHTLKELERDELSNSWVLQLEQDHGTQRHYAEYGLDGLHGTAKDNKSCESQAPVTEIRAKYVVGCDGARSLVRKTLGFRLEGTGALGGVLTLIFKSSSLYPAIRKQFEGSPEGWGYFFKKSPTSNTCGIALLEGRDVFYASVMYNSKEDIPNDISTVPNRDVAEAYEEYLTKSLAILKENVDIKDPTAWEDVHLQEGFVWIPYNLCANEWYKNNAFIAGDAAHLLSPAGGLGMNGGVLDAITLAGKLVGKMRGAPVDFSDYAKERKTEWLRFSDFNTKAVTEGKETGTRTISGYDRVVFGDGLQYFTLGSRAPYSAELFHNVSDTGLTLVNFGSSENEEIERELEEEFIEYAEIKLMQFGSKSLSMPRLRSKLPPNEGCLNYCVIRPDFRVIWIGSTLSLQSDLRNKSLNITL